MMFPPFAVSIMFLTALVLPIVWSVLLVIATCVNCLGDKRLEDEATRSGLTLTMMSIVNVVFIAGWLIAAAVR